MLLLVSGATSYPRTDSVGHLIVPKQGNKADALNLVAGRWAMDNGAFSGFDPAAFVRMLERFWETHQSRPCLFVTAPDVVADAAATLDLWPFWSRLIRGLGYPVAFVAQDGIGTRTPWGELDALFIGGSTEFKLGQEAEGLMGYAKSQGKHVHVGRVNSRRRADQMARQGADSYDGGQFSMFPETKIPDHEAWNVRRREEPLLW